MESMVQSACSRGLRGADVRRGAGCIQDIDAVMVNSMILFRRS